jgi:hypothetical protein
MTSRRLKHLHENHTYFIQTKGSPDTEHKILSLVDEYVLIHQKYLAKGHTKLTEIKQIIKLVTIHSIDNGIQFNLKLHISHYTNLYFNLLGYLARLNSELGLAPASIRSNNIDVPISKDTPIVSPTPTKQSTMFL